MYSRPFYTCLVVAALCQLFHQIVSSGSTSDVCLFHSLWNQKLPASRALAQASKTMVLGILGQLALLSLSSNVSAITTIYFQHSRSLVGFYHSCSYIDIHGFSAQIDDYLIRSPSLSLSFSIPGSNKARPLIKFVETCSAGPL